MKNDKLSRRDFMRNTSLVAAGTIAGALAGEGCAPSDVAIRTDTSKIRNYHPKMHYRRLGKTNLMVSEVSLGGHWKNRNAGRYWDHFTGRTATPVDTGTTSPTRKFRTTSQRTAPTLSAPASTPALTT